MGLVLWEMSWCRGHPHPHPHPQEQTVERSSPETGERQLRVGPPGSPGIAVIGFLFLEHPPGGLRASLPAQPACGRPPLQQPPFPTLVLGTVMTAGLSSICSTLPTWAACLGTRTMSSRWQPGRPMLCPTR